MSREIDVVVIGAGIAGLTAAALLAKSGAAVTLVERHNVAGGCAGFYQRDGYRFDVGATLVGGFGARGVHTTLFARLGVELAALPVEPAMIVHLPDADVVRYGDARWETERARVFGAHAEPFWRRQERLADAAWDFATRFPMLPVDGVGIAALLGALRPRHARLIGAVGKTVAHLYPADPSPRLRAFVDAQLLITAQTDAEHADLAYGATALDLARTGTFHLTGGVAAIATALARAVRRAGGRIAYRRAVERIVVAGGRVTGVELHDGTVLRAARVVAAIPLANVARLLGPAAPLPAATRRPAPTWGAFMAYLALPAGVVPDDLPAHHQTVAAYGAPPGEGTTAFLSFSAPGEPGRARGGGRALTMSTHTAVEAWEAAFRAGTYDERKRAYAARLRTALERVVPGAWDAATFVDLATPHTFEAYTGRLGGLVGGVAQTPAVASLGAASHRSGIRGLTLAGDTVFPGQSTVGASLSGAAAARACGARL